jgi:hypothetical protein
MIDADALHEAEQQALGQLAQMDLSLAAHLHAEALNAEDTKAKMELVRGYARVSRCVRQTIMLRARLRENRERHLIATTPPARPVSTWQDLDDAPGLDPVEMRVDGRIMDLQEAASRIVAQAAPPETPRAERLDGLDRIDAWIDREVEEHEDFGEQPLDEHVLELCRAMRLPEDLARCFRDLPRAPREEDDTDPGYDFGPHPLPGRRETG